MTNWKYTDQERTAVYRINDNGTMESHLVIAEPIQKHLAEGGTIDEPDGEAA